MHVCEQHSTQLNISQESTHTAWSCLNLTFLKKCQQHKHQPMLGFKKIIILKH